MRVNPIVNVNSLSKIATRNMYDVKLQKAKQNLTKKMYVQQIERDYMQRNLKP